MIVGIWLLIYNDQILGVRILTDDDMYYDVDVATYKKYCNYDPRAFERIELIDYNDQLVSEEELYSGIIVEDGSESNKVKGYLRTFTPSKDERMRKLMDKRREKVSKYRQAFYTYLPDEYLQDFANYHVDNLEGNSDYYKIFTPEQKRLIQRYFRWRSRLMYSFQTSNRPLKKSLEKAKKLAQIMGDSDEWYYDGTVDTGAVGNSHCTLGHALRYEHYAKDGQTGNRIVFGKTCFTDFFELDKKALDEIVKAQEYIVKEVKVLNYQIAKNLDLKEVDYHKYLSYKDKLAKHWAGWVDLGIAFQDKGLPLTRSLKNTATKIDKAVKELEKETKKQEIKNSLEEKKKYIKEKLKFENSKLVDKILNGEFKNLLGYQLCKYILAGELDHPFVDLGLKNFIELSLVGVIVDESITVPYKTARAKLRRTQFYIKNKQGKRVEASSTEIKFQQHLIEEDFKYSVEDRQALNAVLAFMQMTNYKFPHPTDTVSLKTDKTEEYATEFVKNLDKLKRGKKLLTTKEFLTDFQMYINGKGKLLKYNQDNRILMSVVEKLEYIDMYKHNLTPEEEPKLVYIYNYGRDLKKSKEVTEELYQKVFERVNEIPSSANPDTHKISKDLDFNEKIVEIKTARAIGIIPERNFVFKIIQTIEKTNRCSEKQMTYLDKAIDEINKKYKQLEA